MADNATVTNQKTTFEADSNTDLAVRSTDRSGQQSQHVRLDVGDGTEAMLATGQATMSASVPVTMASDQDPIPVTGSSVVVNAIDSTAFDLNAGAFSASSSISNDYILNSIEFNFSTTESKTITVTSADGTILYKDTNTSQHVSLTEIQKAFNGGENFTVTVTQFGSAGTMDCIAVVQEGTVSLGGTNPVLGAGTAMYGIPYDFYLEVSKGNVPDHSIGTKFGRNPDTDTGSTPEDVWGGGGTYTGHPTGSPEIIEVFSANANDTSAGTGARTVRFWGLKTSASTAYETEDIILNGSTGVDSVSTWYRLNRAKVLTAGSGGENAGTITFRHKTTTANVFAQLPAGYNQTLIAAYTVPVGHTTYVKSLRISLSRANGSPGSATVSFRCRPLGGVFNSGYVFEVTHSAPAFLTFNGSQPLEAGTDVKFTIEDVSDNNTVIEASMEHMMVVN